MSSFDALLKILELDGVKYVISNDLDKYKEKREDWDQYVKGIKYIFVGDNPGDEEEQNKVYFCEKGKTGTNIRNFTKDFLVLDWDIDIFAINKSLVHTKKTADLKGTETDESQELVANLINEITKENVNCFVCIFGIDSYHSDYFKVFFEKLKKDSELRLYYHPSRRYPISIKEQDEIEAYVEKLIEEKKLTNDQMKKFRNKVFKVYGERLYKFYNKNQIKVSSIMKKIDVSKLV